MGDKAANIDKMYQSNPRSRLVKAFKTHPGASDRW